MTDSQKVELLKLLKLEIGNYYNAIEKTTGKMPGSATLPIKKQLRIRENIRNTYAALHGWLLSLSQKWDWTVQFDENAMTEIEFVFKTCEHEDYGGDKACQRLYDSIITIQPALLKLYFDSSSALLDLPS